MADLPNVHKPHRFGKKHTTRRQVKRDVGRADRNQAKRLYKTNDPTWRRIRRYVLNHEPLCRHCYERGILTPGKDVDHIDGDTYNNTLENLQPLCKPCHGRKTMAENKAKGKGGSKL